MNVEISKVGDKGVRPIKSYVSMQTINKDGIYMQFQGFAPNSDVIVCIKIEPDDVEYIKHLNLNA